MEHDEASNLEIQTIDFVGRGLAFNVVKGCVVKTLEPMTEEARKKSGFILTITTQ